MIEQKKEAHDKNKVCVVVLTHLSKEFGCLQLDLDLHAFTFDYKCFRLIYIILILRFKSKKLVLNTVKFLTLFLVFLKAQY